MFCLFPQPVNLIAEWYKIPFQAYLMSNGGETKISDTCVRVEVHYMYIAACRREWVMLCVRAIIKDKIIAEDKVIRAACAPVHRRPCTEKMKKNENGPHYCMHCAHTCGAEYLIFRRSRESKQKNNWPENARNTDIKFRATGQTNHRDSNIETCARKR